MTEKRRVKKREREQVREQGEIERKKEAGNRGRKEKKRGWKETGMRETRDGETRETKMKKEARTNVREIQKQRFGAGGGREKKKL